jgi:hypothetical protein
MGVISIIFPEDGSRLPFREEELCGGDGKRIMGKDGKPVTVQAAIHCFGRADKGVNLKTLTATLANDACRPVTVRPIWDKALLEALDVDWFFVFEGLDSCFFLQPVELTVEDVTTHSKAHHHLRWARRHTCPGFGPSLNISYPPPTPSPAKVQRTFTCAGSVSPSNVSISASIFNAKGIPTTISGTLMSGPQPTGGWSFQFVVPNPWGNPDVGGGHVVVQATDAGGYTSSSSREVTFSA